MGLYPFHSITDRQQLARVQERFLCLEEMSDT